MFKKFASRGMLGSASVGLLLLVGGCVDDSVLKVTEPKGPKVIEVVIVPSEVDLIPTETFQLTAHLVLDSGDTINTVSPEWTSLNRPLWKSRLVAS